MKSMLDVLITPVQEPIHNHVMIKPDSSKESGFIFGFCE